VKILGLFRTLLWALRLWVNVPVAIFFLWRVTFQIEGTQQNNAGTSTIKNNIEGIEKNKELRIF